MEKELMSALFNTLVGMGTVFLVLIFISLIISLFVFVPGAQRVWTRFWQKVAESFQGGTSAKNPPADHVKRPKRPVLSREEYDEEEVFDDGALIAVIMAAIVASEGGAVSADRLCVRSIKKIQRKRS